MVQYLAGSQAKEYKQVNLFWVGFFFLLWGVVVYAMRRYRIWPLFYVIGTVGSAIFLIYFNRQLLHSELLLARSVAESIHWLCEAILRIPTQVFEEAPGLLMVMVVVQRVGWRAREIGVESSGLLEMSVLISLMLFYPGWGAFDRSWRILVGLLATWIANLVRMMLIVVMLHNLGKEVLLIAHTFLGKLVFFVLTIGIYWFLITKPSLSLIEKNIRQRNLSVEGE